MNAIEIADRCLDHQVREYGPINYQDFEKAFEQMKVGLMSVALDISQEDADVMEKLLQRLDLLPKESVDASIMSD